MDKGTKLTNQNKIYPISRRLTIPRNITNLKKPNIYFGPNILIRQKSQFLQ
jgi:hypothetical protein